MGSASRVFLMAFLFASLPLPALSSRLVIPESPPGHVVDLASIVDRTRRERMEALLEELKDKTGVQMVILTIEGLDGRAIEEFSLYVANDLWRLGERGKDNGLLLTVSLRERVYRFEVGYGLEGILPDSLLGDIGRKYLVPYFRKGAYSEGLFLATLAVTKQIASHYGVRLRLEDYAGPKRPSRVLPILFFLLVFLILFSFFRPSRWRGFGPVVFLPGMPLGSPWSDSHFGGFGGGGGGFGGAGAQGRW
jgi:uncharacterized protein